MNAAKFLENFEILAEAPYGISRLRLLIVELAIRGRFSNVEKKDGNGFPPSWDNRPAHDFFKSRSGNSKLIKGKLFNEFAEGRYPGYSASGQDVWLDSAEHSGEAAILSAVGARCGKAFRASGSWSAIANTHIIWLNDKRVVPDYGMLILNNEKFWIRSGSAQPFVKVKASLEQTIGIPPLAEQKRIVARVDELMALCDQLEQQQKHRDNLRTAARESAINAISTATTPEELEAAWKRINNNWEIIADMPESVDSLRSLILSLAVLGKIVAQDPYEPSIFDELKNVDPKEVGEILSTERQLEARLPSNWVYAGFRHIGRWVGGNGFPTDKQGSRGKEILFCKVSDMNLEANSKYIFETVNSLDLTTAKEMRVTAHAAGTVVFPKIGGAIATNKRRLLVKPTVIDNNCMGVSPSSVIDPEWLYVLFRSIDLTKYQSGTSIPSISQRVLDEIRFGVPPLAEQKRIVTKVAELMALCDQLESELNSRGELAEMFARSVVNAA